MMVEDQLAKLDPKRQARAKEYASIRRRLMLLNLMLGGAYLLLWLLLGWGAWVRHALNSQVSGGLLPFQPHWILQLLLFTAALAIPWSLFDLPLSFYSTYTLPHRYDLSNQTVRGWVTDQVKATLLSMLIGTPLLIGMFALLRSAPLTWWLLGAGGYSLFAIVLTALAPLILMPIFYTFTPLSESYEGLEERLLRLSERAGTFVQGVFTFDMSRRTRAANAALAGLGRSRRIILGDTLLEQFTDDEIETILAHELAHHVHRDIPLGIATQVPLTFGLFFLLHLVLGWAVTTLNLQSISDPASLPLLALLFSGLGLITLPLSNAWSRWRERLADRYALAATQKPEAFISAMTRLANQNLADVDPEPWVVYLLHSHPPLRQRIQYARNWVALRE
jgi:STE24 endopeptidase